MAFYIYGFEEHAFILVMASVIETEVVSVAICNIFDFQAIDTRDALAKSIYACLFEWLVEQINKSLAVGKRRTGRSISILDIYGFESFDVCFCYPFT